jgi:hypothetical protein
MFHCKFNKLCAYSVSYDVLRETVEEIQEQNAISSDLNKLLHLSELRT